VYPTKQFLDYYSLHSPIVFAWMGFGTMAMKWLSVSEGALLVYTMPIWATLFAWPVLGTKPTLRSVGALILGIFGLTILFGAQGFVLDQREAMGRSTCSWVCRFICARQCPQSIPDFRFRQLC